MTTRNASQAPVISTRPLMPVPPALWQELHAAGLLQWTPAA